MHDGTSVSLHPAAGAQRSPHNRFLGRCLELDPSEALFERRGFPDTAARERLEGAGLAFIAGYNTAINIKSSSEVMAALTGRPISERGFFAEGAAMGAAVRTVCVPWRDVLSPLLTMLTQHYVHLAHVGVGWAVARLPFASRRLLQRLDPALAPLAVDGRGFHDGYFRIGSAKTRRRPPDVWGPIYDQGLGRSLWFSCGADPTRIAAAIAREEARRRDDLWAGVGLACVYAGGAGPAAASELVQAAGAAAKWMRQGAAFGLAAHLRAGSLPGEAAAAAERICSAAPSRVADIVERSFQAARGLQPWAYQHWRRGVAAALAGEQR